MDDGFRLHEPNDQPWTAGPVIDLVHLACQTQGDPALESELLDLFQRQCERIIGVLQTSDSASMSHEDLAHTLRGSALAIGAHRVALAAGAYEAARRRGGASEGPLRDLFAAASEARAAIAGLKAD